MPSQLDDYTLTKTLGSGVSAKVKLATHKNGNTYALKIFDIQNPQVTQKTVQLLRDEVNVYKNLDHANIVRLFDFKENADKISSNGKSKKVHYIVLEFVSGGEIFDYVALKHFSPAICRFYFSQMLQALHLVHSKGACHRDLKPENILLDNQYNTKIADFGFAAPVEGRDGSGFLHTVLGTQSYMAPEITARQPYMGHVIDLFALGVILFIMYAGHPPFNQAIPKDPHYKLLVKFRPDMFWRSHEQGKPAGFFSEEFKDLITNMLAHNPSSRLSMADIIGHPWMQSGSVATHDEVKQEFADREAEILNNKAEEAAQMAKQQRPARGVHRALNGTVFYEDYDEVPIAMRTDEKIQLKQLAMKQYERPPVRKETQFFTSCNGLDILQELDEVLESLGATFEAKQEEGSTEEVKPTTFKMHESKWRLKFTLKGRLMGEQTDEEKQNEGEQVPETVTMQVDISKVDADVNCIEFTRVHGDSQIFMQRYFELKSQLGKLNDRVIS